MATKCEIAEIAMEADADITAWFKYGLSMESLAKEWHTTPKEIEDAIRRHMNRRRNA